MPEHTAHEGNTPRMYAELASWWPLLSAPEEYAEEAAFYERTLVDACAHSPRTLLEIGSGGGNNASFLKARFDMVLVDRSPGMLRVSRALNPECEHLEGDMRTLRLGRQFDCVFIQDAICYMTSEEDLRRAIETAFVHCRPGGAALFAPDYTRETFRSETTCGGTDGEGRAIRYLEWTWDPDPADSTYFADYACALRGADEAVSVVHERHVEGLFARADWLAVIAAAGFEPALVAFQHSDVDRPLDVFVGRNPAVPGT
jgi:SAM-dependent methyltransferase